MKFTLMADTELLNHAQIAIPEEIERETCEHNITLLHIERTHQYEEMLPEFHQQLLERGVLLLKHWLTPTELETSLPVMSQRPMDYRYIVVKSETQDHHLMMSARWVGTAIANRYRIVRVAGKDLEKQVRQFESDRLIATWEIGSTYKIARAIAEILAGVGNH